MLPASRLFADVVTLQPGPEGTDAFVAQMNGGMNFGSNTALASGLGPDFGGGEKRAFLQFSLASIPAGATINSATLSLYVSQAAGGAQTASAYKVTSTWDESAVNWNSQPSSDATAVSSVAVNSTGWKSWTITSLVASWCNGSVTNNGVLVKQSSGSPPNNVQFYSSDFGGDATLRPKLVVDYTSVNNPPTAVSLNASNSQSSQPTNITDTTIALSWSQNADADFQSYKLYRSTTPGVTEASTLVSSIQNPASTAFTDTGLTATTAFYYRVFVADTGALSSGSNEVSATTAATPPPPPSVANLSVSATPTSIVADGAAQSTITATLTDVNNQPVADHAVNFTTSAGTLSAASATSNAQGNAVVTLTSSTTAGTANIVSTSSGLTGTCSLTFNAVPPPPAPTLTVTANPSTLTADGASQSTITATLIDGNNQPMAGQTINFQTTAGTLSPTTATTNAQGIATVTLTSGTQAATPTITATSSSATGTCSITFTGGSSNGATVSVAVTPALITADGQSTATVSATIANNGQPVADGTTVTFTTTWGSFQGASPTTPDTLDATTVNGVATVVLLSSNTMPTGTSAFTVTASALGAQATATGQAQTQETFSTRIVVHWLQPTCSFDPCITHGETKSGGGAIHFYWIVPPGSAPIANQPGALMGFTSFRAYEYDKDHKGVAKHPNQEKVWPYLPDDLLLNQITCATYTDPAQVPPCGPSIVQGETLLDFYTHLQPGWNTDVFHNGEWVVEAHYWEQPTPTSPVENKTESIHIYLNNLLVQVTEDEFHPRLLQWRGAGLANKTEVKFTLTCEGEVIISPQVRLYDLSRTDPAGNDAIRTVTLGSQLVTPLGATWTWPWDGQKESATPNQLIPAQPGVYAFEVLADWTGPTCGGEDRKSSQCLSIEDTYTSATSFKPWLNETIDFRYRLNQLAFPGSVKIKVYELTTMTVVRTLSNLPNQGGLLHTVTWDGKDESGQTIVAEPDRYAWSLEAQDDCATLEKGHRQKWVLEKGGTFAIPLYLGEIESGTASPSSTAQILSTSGSSGSPGGYTVLPLSGPAVAHFSSKDTSGHGYVGQFKIYSPVYASFNSSINPNVTTPVRIINLETPAPGGGVTSGSVALVNGGETYVEWDGKDSNGNMMPAGLYPVVVELYHSPGDPKAHEGATSFTDSIKLQNVSNPKSDPFRPWTNDATYNSFKVKYDLSITPPSPSTVHGKTYFKIFDSEFNEVPGRLLLDQTVSSPQTFPDEVTLSTSERSWLLPPDRYYWVVTGINGARQNCIPAMGTFTLVPEVRVRSIEFTSDHQVDSSHNLLRKNDTDWTGVGDYIQPPEYQRPDATASEDLSNPAEAIKNEPITQTRATNLEAKVTLDFRPSTLKLHSGSLFGNPVPHWLWKGYFPPVQGVTAGPYSSSQHTVSVVSIHPLPNQVFHFKGPLHWEWWLYLPSRPGGPPSECLKAYPSETGEHELFVTYGDPDTTMGTDSEPSNKLTIKRIKACVLAAQGKADPFDIAAQIQGWLGFEAWNSVVPPFTEAISSPDWVLLSGAPYTGECGQWAWVMLRAMRLLGVQNTEQRQVFAADPGHTPSTDCLTPDERTGGCFPKEQVMMDFGVLDLGILEHFKTNLNEGENVCLVGGPTGPIENGNYYAVLPAKTGVSEYNQQYGVWVRGDLDLLLKLNVKQYWVEIDDTKPTGDANRYHLAHVCPGEVPKPLP